eukprot:scaffold1786_cov19-Prasinocladus_malaysianus.AAC.1
MRVLAESQQQVAASIIGTILFLACHATSTSYSAITFRRCREAMHAPVCTIWQRNKLTSNLKEADDAAGMDLSRDGLCPSRRICASFLTWVSLDAAVPTWR